MLWRVNGSAANGLSRASTAATLLLVALPALAAESFDAGLSSSGARIDGVYVAAASPSAPTLLLIGGLSGADAGVASVQRAVAELDAERPRKPPANPTP